MKTNKILAAVVLVTIMLAGLPAFSQPPVSPESGGAPIDGGVIALVLGAAALGYKKMMERAKQKEDSVKINHMK